MIKFLITTCLILILCSCTTPEVDNTPDTSIYDQEVAAILEVHPDIFLPETTTWDRTLYSGPVEQHELSVPLDLDDFFEETQSSMEENGWAFLEESTNSIRFTKDDLKVSYNIVECTDVCDFILFVEPKDLFDSTDA